MHASRSIPFSLAETPGDPFPVLGSSGILTKRMDSQTDPSSMVVCQDTSSGTLQDSQKTRESDQTVVASEKEEKDIVAMQLKES